MLLLDSTYVAGVLGYILKYRQVKCCSIGTLAPLGKVACSSRDIFTFTPLYRRTMYDVVGSVTYVATNCTYTSVRQSSVGCMRTVLRP